MSFWVDKNLFLLPEVEPRAVRPRARSLHTLRYRGSNWRIGEWGNANGLQGRGRGVIEVLSQYLHGGTEENPLKPRVNSRCTVRGWNRAPPECEPAGLHFTSQMGYTVSADTRVWVFAALKTSNSWRHLAWEACRLQAVFPNLFLFFFMEMTLK